MKTLREILSFGLVMFFLIAIANSSGDIKFKNPGMENIPGIDANETDGREINISTRSTDTTTSTIKECQLLNSLSVLRCEGLRELDPIFDLMTSSLKALEIGHSSIQALNLSLFLVFPNLEDITVTKSNVSEILGKLPVNLKTLNLSSNSIKSIPASVFTFNKPQPESQVESGNSDPIVFPIEDNTVKTILPDLGGMILKVERIDLSLNKILKLPKSIFSLPRLNSLLLAGNSLEGEFVWDKLWEWANVSILEDADDTFCQFRTEEESYKVYSYPMLGILKAKIDLEETCKKVDKSQCPTCALHGLQRDLKEGYPLSYKGKHGSIAIALVLDCSNRSLETLPDIPEQTWRLYVSNNYITDLSPLKNPMYSNLVYLDLENNKIDIKTLAGAPFLENYIYLNLRNNQISKIPISILNSMKSLQDRDDWRTGNTNIGENYLECDCEVVKEIKPFLIKHSKKITDINETYCQNFYTKNGLAHVSLKDVYPAEVCGIPRLLSDSDQEMWIYMIIGLEAFLILLIVGKVWYDQRRFRKTGVLPWCSKKMPRLPCDTILEGFREPRNLTVTSQNQSISTNSTEKKSKSSVRFMFKTSRSGSDSSQSTQQSCGTKSDSNVIAHGTSGKNKSQASWV